MKPGNLTIQGRQMSFIHNGIMSPPSVILLHGAKFSANSWVQTSTLKTLANHNYSAVAINLPNYNQSTSIDLLPEVWLAEYMNKIKRKSAVFIAPSMGGQYMIPFMIKYPERVDGLIALAPTNLGKYIASYPSVQTHVLGIWGGNDKVVPTNHGKAFTDALPNGEYKEIPGGSHAWYMEKPKEFNDMMIEFIKGLAQ